MKCHTYLSLGILITSLGCSSSYQPRPGPRLSMIVESGKPAYVRDGRVYEHGMVGDGLVEAVQGNPDAVEAAESYRDRQVNSFVAMGLAGVCGAAFAVTATQSILDADEPHSGTGNPHQLRDTLTVGFAACTIGGLVTAIAVQAGAPADHYDAINMYNDGVEKTCPATYAQ